MLLIWVTGSIDVGNQVLSIAEAFGELCDGSIGTATVLQGKIQSHTVVRATKSYLSLKTLGSHVTNLLARLQFFKVRYSLTGQDRTL